MGLFLLAAAAAATGSAAASGSAVSAPALAGPYLQRLTAKSVEIRVETLAPDVASLELERDDHQKHTLTDPSALFHSFHVSGLAPRTHYRYRVRIGGLSAPAGEFVTAPADDSNEPFSFVVYGDNRTDDDAHARVVRAMRGQSFDFLIHTGDFVASGGDLSLWHRFFDIEGALLRDHCLFSAIGNHELYEDETGTNYVRYFGPGAGGESKLYGSFRWGHARFFLLNAFEDWAAQERSWLEGELSRADTEVGLTWRFIVVHHGPWSSGHHGDNATMLAAGVPEILVRHRVDLVLSGHDHMYERGENEGLKYIVSGGGGAPLYPDIAPKPSTRKVEATHHFVLVTVTGEGVRLTTKRPDGTTVESCGFAPHGSWDCDADAASATTPTPARSTDPTGTTEPSPSSPTRCGCRVPGGANATPARCAVMLLLGAWTLARRALSLRGRA